MLVLLSIHFEKLDFDLECRYGTSIWNVDFHFGLELDIGILGVDLVDLIDKRLIQSGSIYAESIELDESFPKRRLLSSLAV